MATTISRQAGYVCKACRRLQDVKSAAPPLSSGILLGGRPNHFQSQNIRNFSSTKRQGVSVSSRAKIPSQKPIQKPKSQSEGTNPAETLKSLKAEVGQIISKETVPEELEILELLERFHAFSNVIIFGRTEAPEQIESSADNPTSATSTLLDLDESATKQESRMSTTELSLPFREKAASTICELLYSLVRDPKVFISPEILQLYVRMQCLLGGPEYVPEIFYLYANKPIARPKTNPVQYSTASPKSPKSAIPLELSDAALDAAIAKRDLPLALSIIDTTVATPAFRRNKILAKASVPLLFVGSTPIVAYAGAHWLSQFQNVWDPEMAKYTAIAGSLAYIGTLTTIGFVAISTYNDQMERVVWRPGTGLTSRWLREEERLYFDRVAMAWGFQKRLRRGEEQGEEWEALREVIGLRSMILDKSDLMEGME